MAAKSYRCSLCCEPLVISLEYTAYVHKIYTVCRGGIYMYWHNTTFHDSWVFDKYISRDISDTILLTLYEEYYYQEKGGFYCYRLKSMK